MLRTPVLRKGRKVKHHYKAFRTVLLMMVEFNLARQVLAVKHELLTSKTNNIMNEEVYQILCRNIETCASSILASYEALNNPTTDNVNRALLSSIIKLQDYSSKLSKTDSLNILLNAERLLKEISDKMQEI